MKKQLMVVVLLVVVFFSLAFTTVGVEKHLADTIPQAKVDLYGLETYLLYESFGNQVSAWSSEQVTLAEGFLTCIDSVIQASIRPSYLRTVLVCWSYSNGE